ncbi:MAG: class I SAM-dependent methyltransferase [Phycisphaeraceae bacterium]
MPASDAHPVDRQPLSVAACADPASDHDLLKAAARLSVDLNIPFLEKPAKRGVDALLVAAPGRLELRMIGGDPITRGGRAVCVNLADIDVTSAAGKRLKQPIAKALGIKSAKDALTVIDATAGWGEDSYLMAGLGCRVLAVERNRITATLLRDGLFRAAMQHAEVAGRITLITSNAIHLLRRIAHLTGKHLDHELATREELPAHLEAFFHPDVVYLDPMFPARKKGAEGKPMKVLRQLVGDDDDATRLFEAAIRVAKKRVIVKRPLKGEPLVDRKPAACHKGKAMRFDVYVGEGGKEVKGGTGR